MNNSTIDRQNQKSLNIEALSKFYSVRDSIPSRKYSTDKSSSSLKKAIDVTYLREDESRNNKIEPAILTDQLSSFKITYNFSVNPREIKSLPSTLSFSELFRFIIERKNIENTEYFWNSRNISKSKIKEYFLLKPSSRTQLREKYAAYVKFTQDIFDILDYGNTRKYVDAYDGAVDLLAECDEDIISNSIEIAREKYISTDNTEIAQSWEKNWDILIKAVSCALKIEPYKKMSLLLSLCDPKNKLPRLIKLTLIDAIVDLDLDKELIMVMLQIFISERESDDFVRNYASEQVEECL